MKGFQYICQPCVSSIVNLNINILNEPIPIPESTSTTTTTTPTTTTLMIDLSLVKLMDGISCKNLVSSHDQVCFEAVPAVVCKEGCTKEQAKHICQYARGDVAEFRSTVALTRLKSLPLPIWINPEADLNHERFVSGVDDTYLHPDLNDPLWRDDKGAKKTVRFPFLSVKLKP